MRSLVDKAINTLQNDGLRVLFIRVWNYAIIRYKRLVRGKNSNNTTRWTLLKDKFKGERIFIIGNGLSLNRMPLYLLEGEHIMAFNRFNLMFERLGWRPDFYMVTDDLVVKDMYEQINKEILPEVSYAFFPDIHPSNVEFDKYIEHRNNVYWLNTDKPEFRDDLPRCGINKTVVNAGIQVAAFLGFSEIYLIGVDMSFGEQKVKKLNSRDWEADDNDPNHFDPRYFGKGRKYHNPTVDEMLEKFEWAKNYFEKRGVSIYNAGAGGNLEVFPRVDFGLLFNFSDSELLHKLDQSPILQQKGWKFQDLLESDGVSESQKSYPYVFRTSIVLGVQLIPTLILDYLPIGPYRDQLFFVKR